MIIDVYTYLHNEEFMLPYFFRHYGRFARKITVFDNESNDGTADLARKLGAEVVPVDTGGKHRVDTLQLVMNEEYKISRGTADWVICAEGDEFYWHPDLVKLLEQYKEEGVTLPKTCGFDMVAEAPPCKNGFIWDEIKNGFSNKMYSKRAIFHPSIDINFGYGGHKCDPKGNIIESKEADILALHYRFLGEDYFAKRYQIRRERLSDEDASRGLGAGCLEDHVERYRINLARQKDNIRRVVP
jgi:hypothetical protein